MTDTTPKSPGPETAQDRAPYRKPELRKYGSVATLTAAVGSKSTPDGASPPQPTMANPS